ncbi:MAG: aconitase X swivel domain-containing protein [Acidimicrobiales bacterium]
MPEARRVLVAGEARGVVLALDEPLSFWGGFEPETGMIIDQAHPQIGESLAGKVVMMTVGRGSSSASSVLAEAIRQGTAPAALILQESDEIIVLGAIVADEIYGIVMPIIILDETTYAEIAAAAAVVIAPDGTITPA